MALDLFSAVSSPGFSFGAPNGAWANGSDVQNPGNLPLAPGSTPSGSSQQSSSGTFHTDPKLVGSMADQFEGLYKDAVPNYSSFMKDPVSSNIFQTQLQSLLASLAPGEEAAREGLTDRFRAAGGLRSGAHGVSGARLEGDIIGRRQNAAGDLLGRTIQQMTQLLGLPISQMPQLINALKMTQSQGSGASWNMNTGGGGGGGGSSGSPLKSGPMGSMSGPKVDSGTGGLGGGSQDVWQDDWLGGGWYPANTPESDRLWPSDGGGGGGGGYESSGDDWNDYYNMGGDEYYNDDANLYDWY